MASASVCPSRRTCWWNRPTVPGDYGDGATGDYGAGVGGSSSGSGSGGSGGAASERNGTTTLADRSNLRIAGWRNPSSFHDKPLIPC